MTSPRVVNLALSSSPLLHAPNLVLSSVGSIHVNGQNLMEGSAPNSVPVKRPPYPWILHPILDVLLGCGGLVWGLFALHYFYLNGAMSGSDAQLLIALSAIGVLIFSETHTASTFITVYRNHEVRSKFSFYTRWLSVICLLLACVGTAVPTFTPILVKIYLLLVPHHFMAQSYGIAMLYCMKRGYTPGRWEKNALLLFVRATTIFAMLRQLTYKEWSGNLFLGQPIPFWGPLPEFYFLTAQTLVVMSTVILVVLFMVRMMKTGDVFPLPAQLVLLSGVTAFILDPAATGIYWLYVSAFLHGSQYLMVIISQHLKEVGLPKDVPTSKIASRLLSKKALFFYAAIGTLSVFIYMGMPKILQLSGFRYATALAAIFTTVNFFHIITDGAIWKLRDKKTRDMLVA